MSCDGSPQHQHVIGKVHGINRSEHAAKYPNRLVDHILRNSSKSSSFSHIHVLTSTDLMDDCYRADHLIRLIEADSVSQSVGQDLYAVEEDEPSQLPEGGEDGKELSEKISSLPLERNISLENLVRRAHCGLGHVSNERLASILEHAKARPEAIQIVKKLVCSTCLQHKRVDGPRKGAPPKNLAPNQVVGVDTVWLQGYCQSGKLKMALNCVCWLVYRFSTHDTSGADHNLKWS